MQNVVPISYHGHKDEWSDHLYGSGLTFSKSKPTLVPGHLVNHFLRHAEFKDARVGKAKGKPFDVTAPPRVPDVKDEPPLLHLDTLTKDSLSMYARRNFNLDLPDKMPKAEMIDTVRRQMGTEQPVGY